MALAFLLMVFLLVIGMIVLFVFPPTRWAQRMDKTTNKEATKQKQP